MAQPYIGEIRMFAGSFVPAGWAACDGQSIPIAENDALYTLIGTTYGGDGESTFALPDLRGRIPVHFGNGPGNVSYPISQMAGTESVTLTMQQIPVHNHAVLTSNAAATASPSNAFFASSTSNQPGTNVYNADEDAGTNLNPATLGPSGGSQPHDNMQPYLVYTFIISLFGIFPSQT